MNKPKRGATPQYDFTLPEHVIDGQKLSSFKSLLSRFNKGKDEDKKHRYDYAFKSNSSKVTATRTA